MSLSEVFNRDCMEALREYPDDFFDLACVDPPYGISVTTRHKAKPEDGGVQLVGSARPFGGKRSQIHGGSGNGRPPIGGGG